MSTPIVQIVQAALAGGVGKRLSEQFGVPPEIVAQVGAQVTPALLGSLMNKAVMPEGAHALFAIIMSTESNPRIGEQLPGLIASTGGLKKLEAEGHALANAGAAQRFDTLTDQIAAQTGVPTQATHALAGVAAATLFGMLKRHFLLSQGKVAELPQLLADQLPEVVPYLTEGIAIALGAGNAAGFAGTMPARLKASGARLAASPDANAETGPAAMPDAAKPPGTPVPKRLPVKAAAPAKRASKWWWLLFAILAAILALAFGREYQQRNASTASLPAPQPQAQPEAAAAQVASAAVEPEQAASEAAPFALDAASQVPDATASAPSEKRGSRWTSTAQVCRPSKRGSAAKRNALSCWTR